MRKDNPILTKPMNVSPELEAIIGKGPMTRKEACDKLWGYIGKKNIIDPKIKNSIMADEKLAKVFGGKMNLTNRDMVKLVSAHLS